MDAFTGAARSLLAVVPLAESSALKSLILGFYMPSPPHLSTIGRLVQDVVSLGQTECLEFCISLPSPSNTVPQRAEIGRQFMSFCQAYPVAFSWLTSLALERLAFGHSDITELISSCGRLRRLTLRTCRLVDLPFVLKIDTPCSGIQELKFLCVGCTRIDLISVPKLRQVIWILPEHPKKLTAMFRNLTSVFLWDIFNECDLNWTLFILEAAPCLQCIDLSRHSCIETPDNSAEKTNVVWEPSKDFKHLNLKLLGIQGCEDEDKVTNYVRLVMERAVRPLIIKLQDEFPCRDCNATNLDRSKADKASRRRIKERLAHGSSSCVKIVI
uniref:FBD domain-containing protein n=1 Tax=Aegilops tauschii TaxID=37682 RepID=M8C2D1_AEGTA